MAKKTTEVISTVNARRAHRRQLPAVMKKINDRLRKGERLFQLGFDYNDGQFPFVVAAFKKQKGWEFQATDYGTINVRLPGEPKF